MAVVSKRTEPEGMRRHVLIANWTPTVALAVIALGSVPSNAQPSFVTAPHGIVAAVLREEGRLRTQTPRTIVVPEPVLTDWSRVRKLGRGREILLTLAGLPRARRYVVDTSESELMVMKLSDPVLPPAAKAALTRAAQQPTHFGATDEAAEAPALRGGSSWAAASGLATC
jgi:hypothetical protein